MGGGINLELFARIESLESEVSRLENRISKSDQEIQKVSGLRAANDRYGMAKLCDSHTVIESEGLVLSSIQNNATVDGTLANRIKKLSDSSVAARHRFSSVEEQYVESQWGNIYSIFDLGFYFFDFYLKNIPETPRGQVLKIAESSLVPVTNCSVVAITTAGKAVCVIVDANNGNVLIEPRENSGSFNFRCHCFQLARI